MLPNIWTFFTSLWPHNEPTGSRVCVRASAGTLDDSVRPLCCPVQVEVLQWADTSFNERAQSSSDILNRKRPEDIHRETHHIFWSKNCRRAMWQTAKYTRGSSNKDIFRLAIYKSERKMSSIKFLTRIVLTDFSRFPRRDVMSTANLVWTLKYTTSACT